jgi:hypothetical protein
MLAWRSLQMQGFEADIVRLTAQLTELRAQYVEADQEREHFPI